MSPEINLGNPAHEPNAEPKTIDVFMAKWGEKYGFRRQIVDFLFEDCQTYSPRRPFHNFEHHLECLWAGMKLVDTFVAKGIYVDAIAVASAIALRDAEDPDDTPAERYQIPEIRGANLLIANRVRYGLDPERALKAADLILATSENANIDSDEKAIVVMADLENVGSEDVKVFNRMSDLYKEELAETNPSLTNSEFRKGTVRKLSKYFVKIWKRGYDLDWVNNAQRNLFGYLLDTAQAAGLSMGEYVASLESLEVTEFLHLSTGRS